MLRVQGPVQDLSSGRPLHLFLGDGEPLGTDHQPTHVVVAYGVCGESRACGARASLAKQVARELDLILGNKNFRYHDFLVYADASSVQHNACDYAPYTI